MTACVCDIAPIYTCGVRTADMQSWATQANADLSSPLVLLSMSAEQQYTFCSVRMLYINVGCVVYVFTIAL